MAQTRPAAPKCLGPRRHPFKEWRLRHQAINLTSPRRAKTSGNGPLKLDEISRPVRMPNSPLKSLCAKKELIKRHLVILSERLISALSYTHAN